MLSVLSVLVMVMVLLMVLHLPQPCLSPLRPRPAVLYTVPPVLDGVVAAVGPQLPGNLSPLRSHLGDERLDLVTLLLTDGCLVQAGLEVLMVSFPALLSRPRPHGLGDLNPVELSSLVDQLKQTAILGL